MSSPLTWTTDKPTKPGWYWYKAWDTRARVVEVVESDLRRRLAVARTEALVDELEEDKYLWAGPLEEPR